MSVKTVHPANIVSRRLFARKGEAAPTNARPQDFGQPRPARAAETVAEDSQGVLGGGSPLSFLIHRKGRPAAAKPAPASAAAEPAPRTPEVRPANGRATEVAEGPRREPKLAVPRPAPAQTDSRPAPQPAPAQTNSRPAPRPALAQTDSRPAPQPAQPAPRPAPRLPLAAPRPVAPQPQASVSQSAPATPKTQSQPVVQNDHLGRRKMTVRLDWRDFRRCRQLVESRGLTYQRVIEIGVRRYLDALFLHIGSKS